MTSRREFLQAAAVLSATPLTIHAGEALPPDFRRGLAAIVIDDRYAAAQRFGARARQAGLTVRAMRGDVTDLWLSHLRPLWKKDPAAIAGLTSRPALFCLEQLARDHRLRVVHHAEHRLSADFTRAQHARLAEEAISGLSAPKGKCGPSTACMEGFVGEDAITLHSWVIA